MNNTREVVYKITYPNGKIYIGKDHTDNINYFGSAKSELIARDFSLDDRKSFTITKDILWSSLETNSESVDEAERRLIIEYESNNPKIGYNLSPKYIQRKNIRNS